jgi:predicted transcriptional regulator
MQKILKAHPMLLHDQELVVLRGLWTWHPSTAAGLQMHLMDEGENLPYNSVCITLNSLSRNGGVKRKKVNGTYIYNPIWTLDQVAQVWLKHLREMIY